MSTSCGGTNSHLFQFCAGILEQSMRARNRVGIGLSYRPARARICKRLWSLESIPRDGFRQAGNRFLGFLKGLQIRALVSKFCPSNITFFHDANTKSYPSHPRIGWADGSRGCPGRAASCDRRETTAGQTA
jgi:hypothetical protein